MQSRPDIWLQQNVRRLVGDPSCREAWRDRLLPLGRQLACRMGLVALKSASLIMRTLLAAALYFAFFVLLLCLTGARIGRRDLLVCAIAWILLPVIERQVLARIAARLSRLKVTSEQIVRHHMNELPDHEGRRNRLLPIDVQLLSRACLTVPRAMWVLTCGLPAAAMCTAFSLALVSSRGVRLDVRDQVLWSIAWVLFSVVKGQLQMARGLN